ncbi:unnamed protein product [Arabis nemorensis]|uniref:Uncharacterized protein n=1 Tax=Arabis nemorensis TaxID=586526 RepID=A0A565CRB5_9BRAS|nr:unnamed protein product [Arabis nemorensis]
MEGENSGGGKIWNGLVRYFYQKISPSQLLAIMILVGLCSNDREATDLLEPGNDYGSFLHITPYFGKVGGFCYERIRVNDITTFMRQTKWGAQYADAVTEIHERRQRNQSAPGSTDPNPGEEGNAPLLTDPVTEGQIAK